MSNVRIETDADYNLKDYRNWQFFLYYGNGISGILNTVGVIAITFFTGFILASKAVSGVWHFKFVEIAMMAMDVYMLSVPFIIFYDTKKNISNERFRAEGGKLVITPENIQMVSESGSVTMSWQKIYKAHITGKGIYLEYDKLTAVIIPKRMLKEGDREQLIKLIKEKVKAK